MIYRHEVLWGLDFARLVYDDYVVEIEDPSGLTGGILTSVEAELATIQYRPLTSDDLGLPSSQFRANPQGGDFLFRFLSDNALSAMSLDGSSLAISFRGTDLDIGAAISEILVPTKLLNRDAEILNFLDWKTNLQAGLTDWDWVAAFFQPLVSASIEYALSQDVENIYFFGHSRGGAVAEWLYNYYAPMGDELGVDFRGVSFASPGVRNGGPGYESGFLSYENVNDIVVGSTRNSVNNVTEVKLQSSYGGLLGLRSHSLDKYLDAIFFEGALPVAQLPDLLAADLVVERHAKLTPFAG